MKKLLFAAILLTLAVCINLTGCASGFVSSVSASKVSSSAAKSTEKHSKSDIASNAALYHKYFDLESEQKSELAKHGYTDAQISKIDKKDFAEIESSWVLSAEDINNAKAIYPDLKGRDLSSWTNADFEAYSDKQDDINYAPTAEQASQLQKRGISLKLARSMLKKYSTYDNMLKQSDSNLSSAVKLYTEANDEYAAFEKEKEAVRERYFGNLSVEQ